MLRPEFVERKLQLMTEDLGRLTTFSADSYEAFIADPLRLAAVEPLLERVILRAIDVNEHLIAALASGDEETTTRLSYRETFLRLAGLGVYPAGFAELIAPSAGLRNILVHEYNDVDHQIVHAAIRTGLDQFVEYVGHVRRFLDARPETPSRRPHER